MKRTIPEQIAANRRGSLVLAFLIVALLIALGTAVVGAYAPSYWWTGTLGAALLGLIVAITANVSGPEILLSLAGAREA